MPFSDPKPVEPQLHLISWGLSVIFIATGISHLLRLEAQAEFFRRLDFPPAAMIAVGIFELLFSALLLTPRGRPWGATGVCLLMFGAVIAHIMTGELLGMLFLHATLIYAAIWVFVKTRPMSLRVTP
jgi:uncharacterized membrane protein YphA (DoxX/SURF4 family)